MVDHALALPWDRYENYDMVVWGVRERVGEGEMEGITYFLGPDNVVSSADLHVSCNSCSACHHVDHTIELAHRLCRRASAVPVQAGKAHQCHAVGLPRYMPNDAASNQIYWHVRSSRCACAGINTGVMLFRNTAWSRQLLDELYGYAQLGDEALQEMRAVRR